MNAVLWMLVHAITPATIEAQEMRIVVVVLIRECDTHLLRQIALYVIR